MNTNPTIFEMEGQGSTLIITPLADLSELQFEAITEASNIALRAFEDPWLKNVIIDCSHTDCFGSSALGFFVRLWKKVKEHHGRMVLCKLSAHEQEILQAVHLDNLWPHYESKEVALQSMENGFYTLGVGS